MGLGHIREGDDRKHRIDASSLRSRTPSCRRNDARLLQLADLCLARAPPAYIRGGCDYGVGQSRTYFRQNNQTCRARL